MTTKVTKESLAENIGRLESYGSQRSISQEYQLEAYQMLLERLNQEQVLPYRSPTTSCLLCQQHHPIGVACPFNKITC